MRWFFRDIILVVGLSIMTASLFVIGLIGVGFDIKDIRENIAVWGLTPVEFGFIVFGITAFIVVIRLLFKLAKFERNRPKLFVEPIGIGSEVSLIVHNKGRVPASFDAIITECCEIHGNLMRIGINKLKNASMIWEGSGNAQETINSDGSKVLKVCRYCNERLDLTAQTTHYMDFYKLESSKQQEIRCADYREGDDIIPKARITIRFDSTLQIEGQREWKYEISYLARTQLLCINNLSN